MYTTAYSLENPNVDLASYIDDFSSFYLKNTGEKADYLSQDLPASAAISKCRFSVSRRTQEVTVNISSGTNNRFCIEAMDC